MPTARPTRDSELKALAECGRLFYERQWMWGTSGNLSVKLNTSPLEFAITPSGIDKGAIDPKSLVVIKPGAPKPKTAAAKASGGPMPSAETVIHQTIHEALPGCGAVFHVHPVYSTLLSSIYGQPKQRAGIRVDWFEMMKGVGVGEEETGEIPIFPNWQDVSLVAREIKQYLMETPKALPVVLIYNHGLTAWGRTTEQAKNHLEIVEYVCKYLYLKRLITR
jgi:methylthioribose-1-phosphate isomerase